MPSTATGALLSPAVKKAARLHPEDDQERAVEAMDRLDQVELPVGDEKDRLVGTVTADDAMDVMQAEATEDMERMAAMAPRKAAPPESR